MSRETVIGKEMPRIDAGVKVAGLAEYMDDIDLAGMLEADLLISPHAHARILAIDVSGVARVEGVCAVITGADVAGLGLYGTTIEDRPVLAQKVVRFVGEPVAAVAATSKDIARRALDLIKVDYEVLPGVAEPEEAMAPGAPILHENLADYQKESFVKAQPGTNTCQHFKIRKGDVDKAFADADYVFEDTYEMPRNYHACLETHAVIAQYEREGTLHLWAGHQSPYVLLRTLSKIFKLPMNRVRVTIPTLGGGFGSKIYPGVELIAVALAQRANRRPVRLVLDREKDFTSSVTNHGSKTRIKTGLMKDGTIIARQMTVYWDTGAYADCGPLVCRNSGFTSAGPYKIDNVKVDAYTVYTNRPVATAFRGYGIPHVTWAYECHIDRIAHEMAIDPLELRLKNIIQEGDCSHTGEKMVAVGMKECLEKVARAANWQPGRTPTAVDLGDGHYRALGLAISWKGTMRHYASSATMRIMEDGSAEVNVSNVDMGQGSKTIWAQIVAEEVGVALDKIVVHHPDTFMTPYDRTTSASRSTFHVGTAVMNAARDAWRQMRDYAARVFKCDPADIVAEGGVITNSNTGEQLTFGQVIARAVPGGVDVIGKGHSLMEGGTGLDLETGQGALPTSFWMYAAQIADVEVDTRTGKIALHRIIAADDVGRAINKANCEMQIQGGVAMGIGLALTEELKFQGGRIVNPNLHDYKIPTCPDVPHIETIVVEVPHPNGPYGAKGLGEAPVGPTAPAIANAVANATGVRVTKTPLTPERVLEFLNKAR